jgi:hypothetical protein
VNHSTMDFARARLPILGLAIVACIVTACTRPASQGASPTPRGTADFTKQGDPNAAHAPPVAYDEGKGEFTQSGKTIAIWRLWRFTGSTDGFSVPGASVSNAPGGGLAIENKVYGAFLRTPTGLNFAGGSYPVILVRIERTKAGSQWEPVIYYTTAKHGETESYQSHVFRGVNPKEGETAILVFNMAKPTNGGSDWTSSRISQFRLQTDDQPGGAFIIRQIAVAGPLPH